jgi:hypothetical protein
MASQTQFRYLLFVWVDNEKPLAPVSRSFWSDSITTSLARFYCLGMDIQDLRKLPERLLTIFPPRVRSMMTPTCISVVCRLLGNSKYDLNVSDMLDAYGAAREDKLKKEWLSGFSYKIRRFLIWNVSVAAVGSVAVCSRNVSRENVITHGCERALGR